MAEFNRSLSTPIESRNRSRNHVSCPRCRVDPNPSHISRQYWEANSSIQRHHQHHQDLVNNNNDVLDIRPSVGGYPDLCRRSNRSYTSPATIHQRPASSTNNNIINNNNDAVATGYYTSAANNSGSIRYSSDTHSTRSAGDTWRIRGILENHPPDITRRAESSMGRLPDVTHTQTTLPVIHARTRSVPVGGVYDFRSPSNRYNIHVEVQQPPTVTRSTTQGIICSRNQQDTLSNASLPMISHNTNTARHSVNTVSHNNRPTEPIPSTSNASSHWKRESQVQQTQTSTNSVSNPWVTMDRQIIRSAPMDRHLSVNASTGSLNNAGNSLNWSNTQAPVPPPQQQNTISNSCWRPSTVTTSSQNALSPCPLPDLVTPRRQARKQCCGLLATHSVAIRWLVVVIAALGLLCSVVGTIVGVVKATGREHLTVALLLIGLGIVLVSMSGVAWRLTSRESPSCRAMFGFRRARHEPHRRFVPRVPHYGRPHPFSAMLYPDITLRPPPPSYQASMQEYRLRLLLMDRQSPPASHPPPTQPPPPPPMYRGPATVYPRFPVNIGGISDYSRPPSYRSRPSSAGQPSPVGPEDVEIINNSTSSSHHLQNDVTSPSAASQQSAVRSAPSSSANSNHVEVVAQV